MYNAGRIPPNEVWKQSAWLEIFERKEWSTVLSYMEELRVKPITLSRNSQVWIPTNLVIRAMERMAMDQLGGDEK